jgi:hypothetical protein
MVSITLRNIPEEILKRIRIFATRERRSVNSEMLILIETGLALKITNETSSSDQTQLPSNGTMSSVMREKLWQEIAGAWKDERSLQTIITESYITRLKGNTNGNA